MDNLERFTMLSGAMLWTFGGSLMRGKISRVDEVLFNGKFEIEIYDLH